MLRLNTALPLLALLLACAPTTFAKLVTRDDSTAVDNQPIGDYVPSVAPAVVAAALYFFSGTIHFIHLFRMGKKYMLVLPLAMYTMAVGFIIRIVFSKSPTSIGLYIIWDLMILLSPCAFLATDYVLLKQLSMALGEDIANECLLMTNRKLVVLFVLSDIVTFLIQSGGGGISASHNTTSQTLGKWIALVGLALQGISFGVFTVMLVTFGIRVKTRFPAAWAAGGNSGQSVFSQISPFKKTPIADWRILFYTMCTTCVGIIIRCIFRVVEYAGGYDGYVQTHEIFFYLFDTVPLFLAMSLYCFVWPPRLITAPNAAATLESRTSTVGIEQYVSQGGYGGNKEVA